MSLENKIDRTSRVPNRKCNTTNIHRGRCLKPRSGGLASLRHWALSIEMNGDAIFKEPVCLVYLIQVYGQNAQILGATWLALEGYGQDMEAQRHWVKWCVNRKVRVQWPFWQQIWNIHKGTKVMTMFSEWLDASNLEWCNKSSWLFMDVIHCFGQNILLGWIVCTSGNLTRLDNCEPC